MFTGMYELQLRPGLFNFASLFLSNRLVWGTIVTEADMLSAIYDVMWQYRLPTCRYACVHYVDLQGRVVLSYEFVDVVLPSEVAELQRGFHLELRG